MFLPTLVALFAALYFVATPGDAHLHKKKHSVRRRGLGGDDGHQGHSSHGGHCRPHGDNIIQVILKHHGEEFCSSYLHLPTTATATTTDTTSEVLATATLTSTITSSPGTTTVSSTGTDSTTETLTITDSETTTETDITTTTTTLTTTTTTTTNPPRKRHIPTDLPFPPSAISSACSRIVHATTTHVTVTATATDTLTSTETDSTTTTLATPTETDSFTTTSTETDSTTQTDSTTTTTSSTTTTTATATATDLVGCYVCPPQDEASFPLGQSDTSVDPIFCSYPAFPGESPNDFYCTYNPNTGGLVTDNDAGFCPHTAISTCPGGARREVKEVRAAEPQTSRAKRSRY